MWKIEWNRADRPPNQVQKVVCRHTGGPIGCKKSFAGISQALPANNSKCRQIAPSLH